jgi:hypothetical protein
MKICLREHPCKKQLKKVRKKGTENMSKSRSFRRLRTLCAVGGGGKGGDGFFLASSPTPLVASLLCGGGCGTPWSQRMWLNPSTTILVSEYELNLLVSNFQERITNFF